jgi:hypothetical protein
MPDIGSDLYRDSDDPPGRKVPAGLPNPEPIPGKDVSRCKPMHSEMHGQTASPRSDRTGTRFIALTLVC